MAFLIVAIVGQSFLVFDFAQHRTQRLVWCFEGLDLESCQRSFKRITHEASASKSRAQAIDFFAIVPAGTEITFAASSFDPALPFFESSEFRIPDFTLTIMESSPVFPLGDVDQNGTVDFLDIGPFIAVLSGGTFQTEADTDLSGTVDFLDIGPFIAILSGS